MSEQSFLRFDDLQDYVASQLGTEAWVTVYEYTESEGEKIGYFCALVAPESLESCLDHASWELLIGQGLPGVSTYPDDTYSYHRFGSDDRAEPFVNQRDSEAG